MLARTYLQVSHWCLCCHIRHSAETGGNVAAVPNQQPSYSSEVPRALQAPQRLWTTLVHLCLKSSLHVDCKEDYLLAQLSSLTRVMSLGSLAR